MPRRNSRNMAYFFFFAYLLSFTASVVKLLLQEKGALIWTSLDITATILITSKRCHDEYMSLKYNLNLTKNTGRTKFCPNTKFTVVHKFAVKRVDTIFISGLTVSMVSLLVALRIVGPERSTKRPRILHWHLFISFIITNALWILLYVTVLYNPEIMLNSFFCEVSHLVMMYFVLTNYMWMHCEGVFLNMSIDMVLFNEAQKTRVFKIIGWIVPLLVIVIYAMVHIFTGHYGECWTVNDEYNWIFNMPLLSLLYMSVANMVCVMLVLKGSLKRSFKHDTCKIILAMLKGGLLLATLLGLYTFLFQFFPSEITVARDIFEVFCATTMSLPGFFLSVGLCYANDAMMQDVTERLWRHFPRAQRSSGLTNGGADNEDIIEMQEITNSARNRQPMCTMDETWI